jgi:hypothetical protein
MDLLSSSSSSLPSTTPSMTDAEKEIYAEKLEEKLRVKMIKMPRLKLGMIVSLQRVKLILPHSRVFYGSWPRVDLRKRWLH